jgi:hypothetical protein
MSECNLLEIASDSDKARAQRRAVLPDLNSALEKVE